MVSLSPLLVPLLSVAFGISSASIATYLYLGMKRIRTLQEPELPVRKRGPSRKTTKRPTKPAAVPPKGPNPPPSIATKLKPIAPSQRHTPSENPLVKEREKPIPIDENTKRSS